MKLVVTDAGKVSEIGAEVTPRPQALSRRRTSAALIPLFSPTRMTTVVLRKWGLLRRVLTEKGFQEACVGLTYSIDHARCEIFAVAEGRITFEDIRRYLEEERAAGGLPCAELIDARKAVPDISAEDVRRVVALLEHHGRSGRLGPTAVVVATDFAYGLIRMIEILVEHVCVIQPFRDIDAAARWLLELRQRDA